MGTSRNGRCEISEFPPPIGDYSLQWGPPGMGGVRQFARRSSLAKRSNFNGDLPEWEV